VIEIIEGITRVILHFGFMQYPTIAEGLALASSQRSELQADFLAGYFAGRKKLERPEFPAAVFATTLFEFGGLDPTSKGHHGTHQERAAAVVRGFEVAYKEKRRLADAIQISVNYVMSL
jgi:hypothetical protein